MLNHNSENCTESEMSICSCLLLRTHHGRRSSLRLHARTKPDNTTWRPEITWNAEPSSEAVSCCRLTFNNRIRPTTLRTFDIVFKPPTILLLEPVNLFRSTSKRTLYCWRCGVPMPVEKRNRTSAQPFVTLMNCLLLQHKFFRLDVFSSSFIAAEENRLTYLTGRSDVGSVISGGAPDFYQEYVNITFPPPVGFYFTSMTLESIFT